MGNKILSFANAFVTPGSVLAVLVAWVATRPDVQLRLEQIWQKVFGHPVGPNTVTQRMEPFGNNVRTLYVNAPVSKSRCKVTQVFRPIRLSVQEAA